MSLLGLEFDTAGGRQKLQCWKTEGIFLLVQSIPSPKAEPFKRWLAKFVTSENYLGLTQSVKKAKSLAKPPAALEAGETQEARFRAWLK